MSFVSYAQNLEDVLLWRALCGVEKGFFIDVGANHPKVDSVTYAFYERGWSGINLEPEARSFEQLQTVRPRDINLKVAAGERVTTLPLYDFGVRGLTTISQDVADRHVRAGLRIGSFLEVPVVPLSDVCAQHVRGEIHFLKIDVEGSETGVIRGMDLSRWRPWILVVEATIPNTQEPSHLEWDPLLTAAQYRFVHFDGLSRYYVSEERLEALGPSFSRGPNIFDDYAPAALVEARSELAKAKRQLDDLQMSLEQPFLRSRVRQLESQLAAAQRDLVAAREAFAESEASEKDARRLAVAVAERLKSFENHPYFKTMTSLRSMFRKAQKR